MRCFCGRDVAPSTAIVCDHGVTMHAGCSLEWDDPCAGHRQELEGETFSYDERDLGGES